MLIPTKISPSGVGELYVVSCYFNPVGYASRLENFKVFYDGIKRTGIKHRIVELGRKSQLSSIVDTSSLIFINQQKDTFIWQKERLLNIAINALPPSCNKVCWVDCDVVFQNDDWPFQISDALNKYMVVQPFSFVVNLPKGLTNVECLDPDSFPMRHNNCSRMYSYILGLVESKINKGDGHPGFAWAARRSLIHKHQLYDRNILGGGDFVMSRAATFNHYNNKLLERYSKYHLADYYAWAQPFCDDVDMSVNTINLPLFHLYHGKINNRKYDSRLLILKKGSYNPKFDIVKAYNKTWEFTTRGQRLQKQIQNYFQGRKEDG